MTFESWLAAANSTMLDEFGIDTVDAGQSESELRRWWGEGMSPLAFVKWQGEKYDLTPRGEWGWG